MTVFIFGAGATRGCSFVNSKANPCLPPLDRDFFTQLQKIRHTKNRELRHQIVSDVVEIFGKNFSVTMETVFSTLEQSIHMLPTTGEGKKYKKSELETKRNRLLQGLAAVLEESLTRWRDGDDLTRESLECDHHNKFVEKILEPTDSVISFNYDCVLDTSLKSKGSKKWNSKYGYGFKLGPRGTGLDGFEYWQPVQPATKDTTVNLLKLHGSLHFSFDNFTKANSAVTLKSRPYTKQKGARKFSIIPPESRKAYDSGRFLELWKAAAKSLSQAQRLVIIGYSLPATDLHASALMRMSVKTLNSLVIVNPDPDARRRIRSVFQSALSNRALVLSFESLQDFVASPKSVWN